MGTWVCVSCRYSFISETIIISTKRSSRRGYEIALRRRENVRRFQTRILGLADWLEQAGI